VKPSHPYLFHTPRYYIYICYNEPLLQPPIQHPKRPQWQTKSKFLMSSIILIFILCSVNNSHLSNILLLQYLSNDNSNDANDKNNIRFRRQQRDDLVGESLYPIQFRNDQHVALNQTQHFSKPHQLLTDSNSTYSDEVNLGVSNHNESISRHRLENHLGSDRSHRRREIELPFARNRSKYPSQSFEMESDSFDRSVKNRAHCGGKVRHSLHVDRDQYANSKVSIVHSNLSYQFKPDATFH